MANDVAVFIGIGSKHDDTIRETLDLGITASGFLVLRSSNPQGEITHLTNLGIASKARITKLQEYLGQLAIHAVDA